MAMATDHNDLVIDESREKNAFTFSLAVRWEDSDLLAMSRVGRVGQFISTKQQLPESSLSAGPSLVAKPDW